MNASDPSGNAIIKDAIKWTAKNIIKPIVKDAQKVIGKINFTFSKGINLSFSPSAFSFNLQTGISIDTKGNVAIQSSFAGGVTVGSPGVSFSSYKTMTNAPSIAKLNGLGVAIGGSIGTKFYSVPLYLGGDVNIIPDDLLNKRYFGITGSAGIGTHGIEGHVEWGSTGTYNITSFNVFDVAKSIYIKIMEW